MKTGSSVILIALAVADSLVLVVGLTDHFLDQGLTIWLEGMNSFLCKCFRLVEGIVNYTAVYYLIIFTIFRVISVYLPHKNNVYCTRKRAFIAVTVTFIIMCLINLENVSIQYFPLMTKILISLEIIAGSRGNGNIIINITLTILYFASIQSYHFQYCSLEIL